MLEALVENILKEAKNKYPQLDTPAALQARITSVTMLPETFRTECRITDKSTGETRECVMEQNFFKYSVKILDNERAENTKYPAIPGIRSRMKFEVGDIVTVVFTGGDMTAGFVG